MESLNTFKRQFILGSNFVDFLPWEKSYLLIHAI